MPRGRQGQLRRMITGLAVLALGIATLTVVSTTSLLSHGAASAGAAPSCPSDGQDGCVETLPCATAPCPTIDVGPASELVDGQYVQVKGTNFPTGDSMRITLCQTASSPTDPSCLWGEWESDYYTPVSVPINTDPTNGNLTQDAYPVFFDQSGESNTALPAHDVQNRVGVEPSFFCDNAPDACALEVTLEVGNGPGIGTGPPDSSSNTAIVPLNFAAQGAGCPPSAPVVNTESSFSMEHFLPAAVDATCQGSGGAVDINTATDSRSVVSDFASGSSSVQIAYVDDPADVTQASLLAGSGRKYAYIPVAVSGTVVSMLAGASNGVLDYPISTYNLTPNMVAGLITSTYESAGGYLTTGSNPTIVDADNLIPPLDCKNLKKCSSKSVVTQLNNELPYNAFNLLNPVSSGLLGPRALQSDMSDVANGASYQATDWICSAPNVPINVTVTEINPPKGQKNPVTVSLLDPNVAHTTLTVPPYASEAWPPPPPEPTPPWVYPTCHAYSTLPSLASNGGYGEFESPAIQAHNIRNQIYGGGSLPGFPPANPEAAFGIMDSSDASFNGLNTAKLQNADGNFVAPTPASIDAALADVTTCPLPEPTCPAGTYPINYGTAPSPDAYPMPDITYALVPTTPQTAADASAEKELLTNLVNFSHTGNSGVLPEGYAPLPDGIYKTAMAEITRDIVAQAPSAPAKGSSGTPTASTPASSGGSTSVGGFEPASEGLTEPSLLPLSGSSVAPAASAASASGSSGRGGVVYRTVTPAGIAFVSLDTVSRFLLPVLLLFALACLIAGPLLLLPELRRRRRTAGGPP
ncbi:MAG: hypothetical protein ACLQPH_08295 [Acidimicrobiales bacterium]